jgi:hypothetical protein
MALTGSTIASTYLKLLRINTDTMGADATASYIQDSADTDSALSISTTRVGILTAAPSKSLDVRGDTYLFDNAARMAAYIQNDHTSGNGLMIGTLGTSASQYILNCYYGNNASNVALRVGNDGKVGIGIAAPGETLTVNDTIRLDNGDSDIDADQVFGDIEFYDNDGGGASAGVTARIECEAVGSVGASELNFFTSSSSAGSRSALTQQMTISNNGDVTFTGDLIMADTKGISFAATADAATAGASMASETLDDYEEGTWDVNITDGTNAMTMDATYDTGVYTKVGNLVTVSGFFMTSSLGSASGNIRITGLPFTIANTFAARCGAAVGYSEGLDITAGESVSYWGEKNTTYLNLMICSSATGTNYMTAAEWTVDGRIMISFSYIAA